MKRKSTKKTISKLCSYLLTVALTVGGLTLSPITTVEVQAAATTKNVNLRLDGDNSIAGISGATVNKANAATVYYGKYPDSTVGTVDTPIPWRVIGYGGNGVASSSGTATLLAADNVITGVEFESSGSSNNYDNIQSLHLRFPQAAPCQYNVKTGQELNFYELTEIVKRKQEIPLGYKKVKDGKMQLTLGPDKREKTVFTQEDYLIVIAED